MPREGNTGTAERNACTGTRTEMEMRIQTRWKDAGKIDVESVGETVECALERTRGLRTIQNHLCDLR